MTLDDEDMARLRWMWAGNKSPQAKRPKPKEQYGQTEYTLAEDEDIPQHLIDKERQEARLRRR